LKRVSSLFFCCGDFEVHTKTLSFTQVADEDSRMKAYLKELSKTSDEQNQPTIVVRMSVSVL
jgi:hypothetical protein